MLRLNSPSQKENCDLAHTKHSLSLRTPQSKQSCSIEEPQAPSLLTSRNTDSKFFPSPLSFNVKFSSRVNGIAHAYAAVTDQGLVRTYNEDRVSIVLNILKPQQRKAETWPYCSFFAVYDGHGGSKCADFLRDNLHQYIVRDPNFPKNPSEAIYSGFRQAESYYSSLANTSEPKDRSGSCAIVVLLVGEVCYIANVGDSRAVMSGQNGRKVYSLSKDHKPSEESEKKRIYAAGGNVYQSNAGGANGQKVPGPFRVSPGRLSVSRTIGDIFAKRTDLGGNPEVIIGVPDIKAFKVQDDHDFVVIGSDGVFDRLSNKEVIQCAWNLFGEREADLHKRTANAVGNIINLAMVKKSFDNLTVVMIAFKNFRDAWAKE